LDDSLAWLFALEQFGIKFGLESIGAILGDLGHPERAYPSIHIGGTNGKGSVSAMIDACLRAGGRRTGRYTSPHLVDVTERVVVDGRPVSCDALADVVSNLRDRIHALRAAGTLLAEPTFFEVTTAAAFELFRRAGVELAVVEVGLGGRLDATNVLTPVATAITSIAIDHERYLGRTIGEIAREKAGIVKPGVPVVVGALGPEAEAAVAAIARDRQAPLVRALEGSSAARVGPSRIRLRTPGADYGETELALAGDHQLGNAVVAVRTLEVAGVGLSTADVTSGLARVEWPGRLDRRRLPDGREVLLDAAHNPEGAKALAAYLSGDEPQPLVFSAMRDKDVAGILAALAPTVSALVLTRATNPRAADPAEVAETARRIAPGCPIVIEPSPAAALQAAWRLAPRIVVAGSIFLLGDVLPIIGTAGA
jgi:dihydrofolate synthase/folylpolyglutamate synthase